MLYAISPSAMRNMMTTTLVMRAKDLVSIWTTIIAPQHRTVLTHHILSIIPGQELKAKGRRQQRLATSHLSWRRVWYTSSTWPARGWVNLNCLVNLPKCRIALSSTYRRWHEKGPQISLKKVDQAIKIIQRRRCKRDRREKMKGISVCHYNFD